MIYDASSSVLVTVEIYESSVPVSYSWANHGCNEYYYRHGNVRLCWYQRCLPKKSLLTKLSPFFDPYSPCVTVLPLHMILPKAQLSSLVQDLRLEFPRLLLRFCSFGLLLYPISCRIKKRNVSLSLRDHVIYFHIKLTFFVVL